MDPLSSPHGRKAPVVLLALALSLAAACSAPAPRTAPPAPTAQPAPTADLATPLAGDGAAACAQGPCEIRVDGPVTIPLAADTEVTEIRVVAVDADGVELVAVVPGRQVSTSCSGPCAGMRTSTAGDTASVRLTAGTGAVVGVNGVTLDVRSATGGAAVLRLVPR